MKALASAVGIVVLMVSAPARAAQPVSIVAAENFYGDVARQIGGNAVKVTSILSNPDQDPHLFEASPSVARSLAGARIVVYNGLDYDPWMEKLLSASKAADRKEIVVSDLIGKKLGDNPHIWYDTNTMVAFAKALTDALDTVDPTDKSAYDQRLAAFTASLKPIQDKIAELKDRVNGTPATATEPVFGYMFGGLGMDVRDFDFQLAVMNNTEPSPSDVAAFESDLKNKRVKLLIYNSQATDTAAQRLLQIAKDNQIPVVGVTETKPEGKSFQDWLSGELDDVKKALPGGGA